MFFDHVTIEVAAGAGGNGCVSFRRETFVPRGGPDGGDGGKGGDVVVQASSRLATLVDLHYQRLYRAQRGAHGRGKSCRGRNGSDAVILVPPGSVIKDAADGTVLAELLSDGEREIVAHGGRGGLGNERFKSSRNRAPRTAKPGAPGEARKLEITLKLIADVGLVGEPNAGKSTLLSVVSAAHPEIADYPFTTRTPVLGIVRVGEERSFVMVDIPGLIEGAHAGKGMGKDFLRHVERCRVILYLVDAALPDPAKSYATLRNELLRYDPALLEKPSLFALTKCDLIEDGTRAADPALLGVHQRVYPVSAVTREGIGTLLEALLAALG
jgi:GTP-binding protein